MSLLVWPYWLLFWLELLPTFKRGTVQVGVCLALSFGSWLRTLDPTSTKMYSFFLKGLLNPLLLLSDPVHSFNVDIAIQIGG